MKELYRLRLKIERVRKLMYKSTGDNLLLNSRLLDKLLNEYEQEKQKVGLCYSVQK